jgi:hypothetical protein
MTVTAIEGLSDSLFNRMIFIISPGKADHFGMLEGWSNGVLECWSVGVLEA